MQKQAPGIGRILVMVIFALSCFGLLLYLWATFGGPVPFKPHGYRVKVSLPQASQLTEESDVRISGISVGKVKDVRLVDNRAQITVELNSKYAPIARDTRAIRRGKTILNEAYLELTSGSPGARKVPDGGTLPATQVGESVDLDQILLAFDAKTRRAMQTWFDQMGVAVGNRGYELNSAIGNFTPFVENLDRLFAVLERNDDAVKLLFKNGAQVFGALSENGDRLRSLIENSNNVFSATASRNAELAQSIKRFPDFLDESKRTLARLQRFADDSDPTVRDLTLLARDLRPVLADSRELAPDLRGFFEGLGPLFAASEKGLPATNEFIDELRPLLAQLYPWLLETKPLLEWIAQYPRETTAFFGNLTAATQATGSPAGSKRPVHYVRVMTPIGAESFAAYPRRLRSNRANNYPRPGAYDLLADGLEVFDARSNCTSNPVPAVGNTNPPELKDLMNQYVFNLLPAATPACKQQAPFAFQGGTSQFPHVNADANQQK